MNAYYVLPKTQREYVACRGPKNSLRRRVFQFIKYTLDDESAKKRVDYECFSSSRTR